MDKYFKNEKEFIEWLNRADEFRNEYDEVEVKGGFGSVAFADSAKNRPSSLFLPYSGPGRKNRHHRLED